MENTAFNKSEGQPHPNGTDILRSKRRLYYLISSKICIPLDGGKWYETLKQKGAGSIWMQECYNFKYWGWVKWSEVAQSCPTLCDPIVSSLPGSAIHGIFQARILELAAISFSRDLPNSRIKPGSPALQTDALPFEPPGKPKVEWRPCLKENIWRNCWCRGERKP